MSTRRTSIKTTTPLNTVNAQSAPLRHSHEGPSDESTQKAPQTEPNVDENNSPRGNQSIPPAYSPRVPPRRSSSLTYIEAEDLGSKLSMGFASRDDSPQASDPTPSNYSPRTTIRRSISLAYIEAEELESDLSMGCASRDDCPQASDRTPSKRLSRRSSSLTYIEAEELGSRN
ncbi:hypothetical protein CC86DRAFT_197239 [Ophiobolus disseminans]|uniref:Uncharacterized protein n=1 Tax=Ophiobolus disseminans TaxID=1469910 RepID=A0A6A7A7H1_9PLEO|nr:hypothetical protein CC86DRAFT_197239 [Ophiobolus disseminans]